MSPFDAIDYAVTILKGALLALAIGLLASVAAPLAAQTVGSLGATDSGVGFSSYTTVGSVCEKSGPAADLPPGVTLDAQAPDPFRATTRVRYQLDAPDQVRLVGESAVAARTGTVVR